MGGETLNDYTIDENLKRDFETICRKLGAAPGAQLSALMIAFIAKHGDKLE